MLLLTLDEGLAEVTRKIRTCFKVNLSSRETREVFWCSDPGRLAVLGPVLAAGIAHSQKTEDKWPNLTSKTSSTNLTSKTFPSIEILIILNKLLNKYNVFWRVLYFFMNMKNKLSSWNGGVLSLNMTQFHDAQFLGFSPKQDNKFSTIHNN